MLPFPKGTHVYIKPYQAFQVQYKAFSQTLSPLSVCMLTELLQSKLSNHQGSLAN